MRHGAAKKSTGLRDAPGNEKRVLAMLDKWVESRLYPAAPASVAPAAVGTVSDLAAQFVAAKYSTMSLQSQQAYTNAIAAVFPESVALDFVPLVDYLSSAKARLYTKYKPATVSRYLVLVKSILQFGVERGALPRNPLNVVGVPPAAHREEAPTYTALELTVLSSYLPARTRLLIALLSLTAMRSFEALALTPASISRESIRIEGKGNLRRKRPVRHIPLNPLGLDFTVAPTSSLEKFYHDLNEVVGMVLALDPDPETGRFFSLNYTTYRNQWVEALARMHNVKLDGERFSPEWRQSVREKLPDARRLHALRATAEERWESIGFDPFTVTDQAGHSLEVYVKRYRARQTVEKTSERIRMLRPAAAADNELTKLRDGDRSPA